MSERTEQTVSCFILLDASGRVWISAPALHEVGPEVRRKTGCYLPALIASGCRVVEATMTWAS